MIFLSGWLATVVSCLTWGLATKTAKYFSSVLAGGKRSHNGRVGGISIDIKECLSEGHRSFIQVEKKEEPTC